MSLLDNHVARIYSLAALPLLLLLRFLLLLLLLLLLRLLGPFFSARSETIFAIISFCERQSQRLSSGLLSSSILKFSPAKKEGKKKKKKKKKSTKMRMRSRRRRKRRKRRRRRRRGWKESTCWLILLPYIFQSSRTSNGIDCAVQRTFKASRRLHRNLPRNLIPPPPSSVPNVLHDSSIPPPSYPPYPPLFPLDPSSRRDLWKESLKQKRNCHNIFDCVMKINPTILLSICDDAEEEKNPQRIPDSVVDYDMSKCQNYHCPLASPPPSPLLPPSPLPSSTTATTT